MSKIGIDDTIAAIATPIGEGGIGIVRLSGKDALAIADVIFVSRDGAATKPSGFETYTTHYGRIVIEKKPETGLQKPEVVDEVILTVMRSPRSYTREDVVEINCHGGIVPLRRVLELVLLYGARLAEPGEFTRRAFLNGRIDLVQAEAVLDIIRAKTEKGLEIALLQLEGELSRSIRALKDTLVDIKVDLEAAVDFPDEELDGRPRAQMNDRLRGIKDELELFIRSADSGRIIREGITCVICGRPNVGKSSLMNTLLKEERVIVTPVPGTTRDAISEYVNVSGIPLNIVDTAGITPTNEVVEKESVIRSKLYLDKADIVLFMMDGSEGLLPQDREIIELLRGKEVIVVINKIDLPRQVEISRPAVRAYFGSDVCVVEISALRKLHMDKLTASIADSVWKGNVSVADSRLAINARHKASLAKALRFVNEAIESFDEGKTEEIIASSVDEALRSFGEVTGDVTTDEVLERIFEQFCVGK